MTETVTGTFSPDGRTLLTLDCDRTGVTVTTNEVYTQTTTTKYAFKASNIPMRTISNAGLDELGTLGYFERGEIGGFDYFNLESADVAKYVTYAAYESVWVEDVPRRGNVDRAVDGGQRFTAWDYTNAEHKPRLTIRFVRRK